MKKPLALLLGLLIVTLLTASAFVYAAEEPWQHYDFEGRTVRIAFRFHEITPLGERGDFTFLDPDPRLQGHIEQVEQMFNVRLEFPQHAGDNNLLSTYGPDIIAGDLSVSAFEADLHSAAGNLIPLAMQGYIYNLDDILDQDYYNSLPVSYQSTDGFEVHGSIYGFEPLNALIEPVGILWNKDHFEREGLPDLYELYRNNEWTWDVFQEIILDQARDTSGDGEIDFYGLNTTWGRNDQIANFVFTNAGSLTTEVDGRVVVNFDAPEAVEAFEFLQNLWQQNAVLSMSLNGAPYAAMHIGSPHILQFAQFQDLDDLFGYVPLPMGPRSTEYVHPYWNRWMALIPVTEPNPRGVIEIVNALRQLTPAYLDTSMEEWEAGHWEHWGGFMADRDSIGVWQEAAVNRTHADNRSVVMRNGLNDAINQIINNNAGVTTSLASVAPQIQSVLDEVFND